MNKAIMHDDESQLDNDSNVCTTPWGKSEEQTNKFYFSYIYFTYFVFE